MFGDFDGHQSINHDGVAIVDFFGYSQERAMEITIKPGIFNYILEKILEHPAGRAYILSYYNKIKYIEEKTRKELKQKQEKEKNNGLTELLLLLDKLKTFEYIPLNKNIDNFKKSIEKKCMVKRT
jgi:hypothetical protein